MSNQLELDPKNQLAIAAALESSWDKAVELNNALLEDYPEDIDVLNRLAHAQSELGQINKARSTYQKVLEIDAYNPIATRNLTKLTTMRGNGIKPKEGSKSLNPEIFLEDPGKTKTIQVMDLAMPKVLVQLRIGDVIQLHSTKDSVSIVSEDDRRLGKLETSWGKEIAIASSLGSEFSAVIKSVMVGKDPKESSLTIFIREIKRSSKLVHPPFPIENNNFTPYVKEETLGYVKQQDSHSSDEEEEINHENIEEEPEAKEPIPLEHQPQESALRDFIDENDEENLHA